ncbi:MAG TPA: ABC transporter substrate-binding protein [Mycobacteriales bacterium]|nr:ABC transporter substrate-binding protein [Mycobacteriales bacterium]
MITIGNRFLSRRPTSVWRGFAATVALALIAAVAFVGAAPTSAAAASGSKLTVASDTEISTFNPFLAYFDGELNIIGAVYPALTVNDANNKPTGYLATKWTTSADQLTWTFTIRSGLKWSDGKPITAQDIAWTYNLVMTNDDAATANGSLVANYAKVTAPDATTLVIKTKTPQANMLYNSIPVVPEHIWKSKVANLKNFKNMQFPVVGYGPYELVGYKTDQYATLRANKKFFMGAPKYDTLVSQYFKNSDASVAALKSGQLNQDAGITATQFKALKNTKNVQTYQQAPTGWTGIEINPGARTKSGKTLGTGNPALKDIRVRTAIAWAIDRKTLVTKVLDGLGQAGAGYIPSGYPQWAWAPDASQEISYNPGKANQILDQAGYKKGPDGIRVDPKTHKKLSFRFGIHSDTSTDAQISTYVEGWLKAVGIQLKIDPMSFTQLNKDLAKGDWDILMDAWSTGADPTYLLSIQTCGVLPKDDGSAGNTDAFFCNSKYDALYKKQIQQFDQTQRAVTIRQMQNMLYNANVDIMLYYSDGLSAVRTNTTATYMYGKANSDGIFPLQNIFYDWRTAAPTASSGKSSSNTGLYTGVGIAVVVVIVAAGLVFWRRRSTAADRE